MIKFFLMFLLAIGLVACSGEGEAQPQDTTTTTTTASGGEAITLENAGALGKVSEFRLTSSRGSGIAYSPDGSLIAIAQNNGIAIHNASDFSQVRVIESPSPARSVTFSPDGTLVLGGYEDEFIRLSNVSTGEEVRQFTAKTNFGLPFVSFSPDGTLIFANAGGAFVWDVATGDTVLEMTNFGDIRGILWADENATLYTVSTNNIIEKWDVATSTKETIISSSRIGDGDFSPDGTQVAVIGNSMTVRELVVFNVQTTEEVFKFEYPEGYGPNIVLYNADGTLLVTLNLPASATDKATISIFNAQTGEQVANVELGERFFSGASLSPDATTLLVVSLMPEVVDVFRVR